MSKSTLDMLEEAFVSTVNHTLNSLWLESSSHVPRVTFEGTNGIVVIESVGDDAMCTLSFHNLNGKIISYFDFEEGVGVTGYDAGEIAIDKYYELSGLLLAVQLMGLIQISKESE